MRVHLTLSTNNFHSLIFFFVNYISAFETVHLKYKAEGHNLNVQYQITDPIFSMHYTSITTYNVYYTYSIYLLFFSYSRKILSQCVCVHMVCSRISICFHNSNSYSLLLQFTCTEVYLLLQKLIFLLNGQTFHRLLYSF